MLSGCNNEQLRSQYGFEHAGQYLFWQRWVEMFHRNTLPTYQFRIHNSHGLLEETLVNIADARKGYGHLEDILKECRTSIEEDGCLKKHCGALRGRIIANLKIPSHDDRKYKASLLRLEYQIRHALQTIKTQYLQWIFEDIKAAIDMQDAENIDRLSVALASELLNNNWLPQSLNYVAGVSFNDKMESFDQRWRNFLQKLQEACQDYHCFFSIKLDRQAGLNNLLDLPILTGAQIVERFPRIRSDKLDLTAHYIQVISAARANDLNSAVMNAYREILKKLAIVNYYIDPVSILGTAIVVFPNGNGCTPYTINGSCRTSQRYTDQNFEHIRRIDSIISTTKLGEGTQRRILNFLRQYQLGITTISEEQRFGNLWIAIESFVSTGQYGSIIEHVKQIVPAIHCQRYIYHLLKNFIEDCERCGVTPKYNGILINTQDVKETDVEKMLQVFRNNNEYDVLISECEKNTLLKLRCEQICLTLSNNKSVTNLLENHKNHLTWQLQRLYRVRNNLMHAADIDPNIFPLMIHLNHYVRAVFGAVIHQLANNGDMEAESLFARFVDNYAATIDILNVNGSYENSLVLRGALF